MNNSSNNNNEFDFENAQLRRQNPQNPYANSFRNDNAYHNKNTNRYESQNYGRRVRKQQSQLKFNWGTLVFIIIIAIVVIVIIVVAIVLITKAERKETFNKIFFNIL